MLLINVKRLRRFCAFVCTMPARCLVRGADGLALRSAWCAGLFLLGALRQKLKAGARPAKPLKGLLAPAGGSPACHGGRANSSMLCGAGGTVGKLTSFLTRGMAWGCRTSRVGHPEGVAAGSRFISSPSSFCLFLPSDPLHVRRRDCGLCEETTWCVARRMRVSESADRLSVECLRPRSMYRLGTLGDFDKFLPSFPNASSGYAGRAWRSASDRPGGAFPPAVAGLRLQARIRHRIHGQVRTRQNRLLSGSVHG